MFVTNAWYIGALSHELGERTTLARRLLDRPVVFFRPAEGGVAALRDICPHRYAPLSSGRVGAEGLQCGYHGMTFDASGKCVSNPVCPTDPIPKQAQVRSYPCAERHGMIWIWPGDAEIADPDDIPDYHWYASDEWESRTHHMRVDANFLLLVDNLMDLSHIAFVHAEILGNDDVVDQEKSDTIIAEHSVTEKRLVIGGEPIPVWRDVLGADCGKVDLWMDISWSAASNIVLDVGSTPTGRSRGEGAGIVNLDCITPETARSSHYFYGHARQYATEDAKVSDFWDEAMARAFSQDKAIVEAVQRNMGDCWDLLQMSPPPVINRTDKAAMVVRRKIRQLMNREGDAERRSYAEAAQQ